MGDEDSSDQRAQTGLDRALDVLVFAPLGLVFSARELLPDLASKGRQQMEMAHLVGRLVVRQGQNEAERGFAAARRNAESTLESLGSLTGNRSEPLATGGGPRSARAGPRPVPNPPQSGPGAAGLAIPDYDSLAASQVVPRLVALGADELDAVLAYESAHRGRKTIVNRIQALKR